MVWGSPAQAELPEALLSGIDGGSLPLGDL